VGVVDAVSPDAGHAPGPGDDVRLVVDVARIAPVAIQ
jgi:hypothetical protein